MRPRSATEWRDFWRDGGATGLRALLREAWPPLGAAGEGECAHLSTRIATLLGSRAPLRALVSELGRIREHELGLEPDAETDGAAAERLLDWFEARTYVPESGASSVR